MIQQFSPRPRVGHLLRRRLQVEALEDRRMLSVVTVDTGLDTVDPDDGVTSLREAIFTTNTVAGPDDIVFDFGHDGPAAILLEQGELEITDGLTITGAGPDLLTIEATRRSRIFNITAQMGDFTIAGMTLTGGRMTGDNAFPDTTFSGGAIRSLTTGSLTIENSDVRNNHTTGADTLGGGIFARGDVTISGSTISGNSAGLRGGGIGAWGTLVVTSSTISGNAVGDGSNAGGGGIYTSLSQDVTVTASTISGNSADRGGGIWSRGQLTVTSSTISENSGTGINANGDVTVNGSTISENSGHGISGSGDVTVSGSTISENGGGVSGNDVTVTSSTISENSGSGVSGVTVTVTESTIAENNGSGVSGNDVTVTGSTISGNSADEVGGGIAAGGTVAVTGSTIAGNWARSAGGGISVSEGPVTINNSIVARNTAGTAPDLSASTSSIQHSLIGDNSGTNLTEAPVDAPDTNGNLIGGATGGVIDPLLGPLNDNGGLMLTHALLPGSPAIDAGDPLAMAGVGDVPEFDARGTPFTRVSGDRIDMGALERGLAVEILDVASPTAMPVDEATIQFTSAVTGFDVDDVELSLGGGGNLLTASQTLSTSDNQTFVLSGLSVVTSASGYYTLKLISPGSGIVDADGVPLDTGDSMSWAMGRSVLGLTVDTLVDESDGSIDDGDISLRDAIAAAAPGETIDFDTSLDGGTTLLTLGELSLTRSLTIDATNLATGLVIDAAGNDPTPDFDDGMGSRIFDIDDGNLLTDSPVTLRGLTLTGGDVSGEGGAIRAREPLTVTSSTISENSANDGGGGIHGRDVTVTGSTISADKGGGIFALGDVTVTSSTISENSAGGNGGGIRGHNVTVTNCTVSRNSAGFKYAGGISASGNVTVTSSTISENSGRGIRGSDVTVTDSTISENGSMFLFRSGGVSGGNVTVTGSTISENRGSGVSGGGFLGSNVTVTGSTISGNLRGGIRASGGEVTVTGSTISGNSADYGGGILGSNVTVTGSTISGNSAESGGGIDSTGAITIENSIVAGNRDGGTAPDVFPGTVIVQNSLIGDNSGTDLTEAPVGSPDANGNLIGGPVSGLIDPLLDPLADNGGPTWTHALLVGSPAIDAGDPLALAGEGDVPEFDQRGAPYGRVYDGDGVDGPRIDMGAFELQPRPGDLNGDLLINFGDLAPFAIALTEPDAYEAIYPDLDRVFLCDVSGDGLCNFDDLAPFAALLTDGEGGTGVSASDGDTVQLATVPGDLSTAAIQPGLSHRVVQRDISGGGNSAGLRDRALIAWLASLREEDANGDTESTPRISETAENSELPVAVVESVFQGLGE